MNNKGNKRVITLEEFIIRGQNRFPGATGELSQLLRDIGLAAKIISREVNKAGITNILGEEGSQNIHGESVKKLDLFADDQLISALDRSNITCMVISEENDGIVRLSADAGKYIVYLDPLDGSSNIDVNVSIGSIFSVYMRKMDKDVLGKEEALQPGVKQVAAGYVLYGSSTIMAYTTGLGVSVFTLDPSIGEFILCNDDIKMPEYGTVYSLNEGYYNSWDLGLKKYIKYCQVEDNATKRPYKARYIGSMVADLHRTLMQGGIFIYPHSSKYPNGKLRLMYECNPLSFIIEQAGGIAINGENRIMEIEPRSIHQRTPIYIGSKQNVLKLKEFLDTYSEEATGVS
ncbi:class 1 fructose-bisphosphatase [Aliifodinibius sp. S!AR15-10]|uniref:class 1 fructose-bisphosphatase n=1 Tax=Aliifodinibius sp. S!AR15-10 TaxID=2950437 RepID=UPI002861107F|nr:class 1 fructose-bisphosphatase [Aliifodinibius sp. S!AR15-10]MDR8390958.1 class 1 fructose-bisphosphatase [Aliifodinibius sp. S!AR15-10]